MNHMRVKFIDGGKGLILAAALFCGAGAQAQSPLLTNPPPSGPGRINAADFLPADLQSEVLTVDTDRLFSESRFGRRKALELTRATEDLSAENRRIEAELLAEEQSLTQRRPTMPISEFRAAADAFDARVQAFRTAQDSKEVALQESLTDGRDAFLQAAAPILGELMQAAGATVVLDRRTVFLALAQVDITDEAIAAIDAVIGDGVAVEEAYAADRQSQEVQRKREAAVP